MAKYVALSSFSGTAILSLDGTSGSTNSITGLFNFKNVRIDRPHNGKANFSADIESDGAIEIVGLTGTGDVAGFGGGVTITNLTANFAAWNVAFNMDTEVYSTFASRWKSSKLTTGNCTGSVSGVCTLAGVVATASATG